MTTECATMSSKRDMADDEDKLNPAQDVPGKSPETLVSSESAVTCRNLTTTSLKLYRMRLVQTWLLSWRENCHRDCIECIIKRTCMDILEDPADDEANKASGSIATPAKSFPRRKRIDNSVVRYEKLCHEVLMHPALIFSELSDEDIPPLQKSQATKLCNSYIKLFQLQYKKSFWIEPISTEGRLNETNTSRFRLLGCQHYARNCKVFAECCGIWVACRHCHDESLGEHHKLDRHAIERILCSLCWTDQREGSRCQSCGVQFARYFCNVCKFYENTPHRTAFHCEKCGICRRGLGKDSFHCEKCDACVAIETRDQHNCLDRCLHAECPVCLEFMFTSTTPVLYMPCGHPIHEKCFQQYKHTTYECLYCALSADRVNFICFH